MEDSLVLTETELKKQLAEVLILVVMEDSLVLDLIRLL